MVIVIDFRKIFLLTLIAIMFASLVAVPLAKASYETSTITLPVTSTTSTWTETTTTSTSTTTTSSSSTTATWVSSGSTILNIGTQILTSITFTGEGETTTWTQQVSSTYFFDYSNTTITWTWTQPFSTTKTFTKTYVNNSTQTYSRTITQNTTLVGYPVGFVCSAITGNSETSTTTQPITTETFTSTTSSSTTSTYTTSTTQFTTYTYTLANVDYGKSNSTLYFTDDITEVNSVSGYALEDTWTNDYGDFAEKSGNAIGDVPFVVAFDIYKIDREGGTTLLGSKVGAILVDSEEIGSYYEGLWDCPSTNLVLGYDALEIRMFFRFGTSAWGSAAQFLYEPMTSQFLPQTWMFRLFAWRTYSGGPNTYAGIRFDTEDCKSAITNMGFAELSDNDMQTYRWNQGDIFGMILGAYVDKLGLAAYIVILLIPTGTLYLRHKNVGPVVFMFILFGAGGGILWLFVPPWAAGVASGLLVLGFCFILWKVIR